MDNLNQAYEAALKQEGMLQFDSFNNQEAWNLGKFMVNEINEQGIDLAVCIRKLSGYVIFQHGTSQTSLENQIWMDRKFNTVSMMERSSLRAAMDLKITATTAAEKGFSEQEYAFCGGGFPICIKNSGMIAVLTVSYLPHVEDHNFIVRALAKYLNVSEVPDCEVDF